MQKRSLLLFSSFFSSSFPLPSPLLLLYPFLPFSFPFSFVPFSFLLSFSLLLCPILLFFFIYSKQLLTAFTLPVNNGKTVSRSLEIYLCSPVRNSEVGNNGRSEFEDVPLFGLALFVVLKASPPRQLLLSYQEKRATGYG